MNEKLKQLKKLKDLELESNMKLLSQNKKKNVCYGSDVFLMHADSRMFMTGTVSPSESDKSAYKLELSTEFCRGMIFRIMPKYRLRQEGDPIQFHDQIILINIKLSSFTNFQVEKQIELDRQTKEKDSIPLKDPYYRFVKLAKNEGRNRFECFISNNSECTWQMLPHKEYHVPSDEDGEAIRGGDLIQLRHQELQGFLSSDYCYKSPFQECFIRNYTGQYEKENIDVSQVWEVEIEQNLERGAEIQTVRKDEDANDVPAALPTYRLRNYLTGKLMTLTDLRLDGNKQILVPCQEKDEGADKALTGIQFISTTAESDRSGFPLFQLAWLCFDLL